VRVVIDRNRLEGRIDLVESNAAGEDVPADAELARRAPRGDLAADTHLPPATRLWAALQNVSGGTWGGCVYDVDRIVEALGKR
jgi:xylonate dehydratase